MSICVFGSRQVAYRIYVSMWSDCIYRLNDSRFLFWAVFGGLSILVVVVFIVVWFDEW